MTTSPILVLGGTGKTGRRILQRLEALGLPTRCGSRSAEPAFDWQDRSTWPAVLEGARAAYISYYPDLAVPGAVEATQAFTQLALEMGVRKLVLLSGRGEPEAQSAEQALQATDADWTILRASWFMQNFSENFTCSESLAPTSHRGGLAAGSCMHCPGHIFRWMPQCLLDFLSVVRSI